MTREQMLRDAERQIHEVVGSFDGRVLSIEHARVVHLHPKDVRFCGSTGNVSWSVFVQETNCPACLANAKRGQS